MKAAIFDMDGTILDSMGMWVTIMPRFLLEMDIIPDKKFMIDTASMSLNQMADYIAKRYKTLLSAEEIKDMWKKAVLNIYLSEVPPKAGVESYLKKLKEAGVKISLATLTEHYITDKVLKEKGLSQYFDFILTTEDTGMVGKERPDLFLKCARLMGVEPSECVIFEDSYYPLPAAKKAGFRICVINDSVSRRSPEEFISLADRYIYSFNELL